MKREPTYFHMDTTLKDAMRQIADYKHATLSNLIEEAARLLVSSESAKIQKEIIHKKKPKFGFFFFQFLDDVYFEFGGNIHQFCF